MVRRRSKILQGDILQFIRSYIKQHSYPPSIRDIARYFERSPTGIYFHMQRLVEEGKLSVEPGRARAIRIIEQEVVNE